MLSFLLSLAAAVATPASTSQCTTVSPVTTSTNIAGLQADADCFGAAAASDSEGASLLSEAASAAKASEKYRLDRIAYLKSIQTCPDGSVILATAICPPSTFAVANMDVDEAAGKAVVTITRTFNSKVDSTIYWNTLPGTAKAGVDYTNVSGSLSWPASHGPTKTVTVPLTNDTLLKPDRAFYLHLNGTTNAVVGPDAVVTINDDDPPPPQTCPDGTVISADAACPPPATQTCADGSVIPADQTCPVVPDYSLGEKPIIPDNFDINQVLVPGRNPVPTNLPDVVGAFRFLCGPNHLMYDDSVVFQDKPAVAHGHAVQGRADDAYLTYELARASGGSTCNNAGAALKRPDLMDKAANRTPYWSPWLQDDVNVYHEDYAAFYYKREPASSAACQDKNRFPGGCQFIPRGIEFVNGNKPDGTTPPGQVGPEFLCIWNGGSGVTNYSADMQGALDCAKAKSAAGLKGQLEARLISGDCWSGKIDSPDHYSNVVHQKYVNYIKTCDAAHPIHIPFFQYSVSITILATDDTSRMRFSCDDPNDMTKKGRCWHVDYGGMAWSPVVAKIIEDNCINKQLSCQGGEIGDGRQLAGNIPWYQRPDGTWYGSLTNPNRVTPIPPRPAPVMAH